MQRWLFRRELARYESDRLYYLDECGVDHGLYREYGRAVRGQKLYTQISGRRHQRTSIIAAARHGRRVAPMLFDGSCTAAVVTAYFTRVLLPHLPEGSVIVLDNARFHHIPELAQRVAQAGCELLFLPAYSPDLNPIEPLWAVLKSLLRPLLARYKNKRNLIAKTCLSIC